MAPITYNSTEIAIEEGAMFVFSSWVCNADGLGGFSSCLTYPVSSLPHPASSSKALGVHVDKLGNLEIADLISTRVCNAESKPVPGPSKTHIPGVGFRLRNSARTLPAEHDSGLTKNHLDSKVVPDNNATVSWEA
jgi:hypothetical protein